MPCLPYLALQRFGKRFGLGGTKSAVALSANFTVSAPFSRSHGRVLANFAAGTAVSVLVPGALTSILAENFFDVLLGDSQLQTVPRFCRY